MPLKAILLDIDGTLLDSNDAHTRAWLDVLRRHGHATAYDDVRPLIGKGGDKLLLELVGFDDAAPEGKAMAEQQREVMASTYLPTLRPTPGARALLLQLKDMGLRLVAATSSDGEQLSALLNQAGVLDLIDAASSSSDAEGSKPDPDILLAAIRKARVEPAECLMLGDTPYDITAAEAAGVQTIALRCGGWWNDGDLGRAVEIYDDPAALLDAFAASAIGRAAGAGH